MTSESSFIRESPQTRLALITFLPRVRSHVTLQTVLMQETFGTDRTRKRFNPCVDFDVFWPGGAIRIAQAANIADVRFLVCVSVNMLYETLFRREGFITDSAAVWLFPWKAGAQNERGGARNLGWRDGEGREGRLADVWLYTLKEDFVAIVNFLKFFRNSAEIVGHVWRATANKHFCI